MKSPRRQDKPKSLLRVGRKQLDFAAKKVKYPAMYPAGSSPQSLLSYIAQRAPPRNAWVIRATFRIAGDAEWKGCLTKPWTDADACTGLHRFTPALKDLSLHMQDRFTGLDVTIARLLDSVLILAFRDREQLKIPGG